MALGASVRYLLRETAIWGTVLGAGFAGVYYFDEMRAYFAKGLHSTVASFEQTIANKPAQHDTSSGFERSVTLRAGRNGHFIARAHINGRPVSVMVDTGATGIALSYEDARSVGISVSDSDYSLHTRTANGIAKAAPVKLDNVRIGDVEVKNLRGTVAERGKLHITLLGMEFIRRLNRFELRGHELLLVE
jgi:aspartyl protease family protein